MKYLYFERCIEKKVNYLFENYLIKLKVVPNVDLRQPLCFVLIFPKETKRVIKFNIKNVMAKSILQKMIHFDKLFYFFVLVFRFSFEEEFCVSETFKPACLNNEILFITDAIYGRKNFGKCIREKSENKEALSKISGYINCYTDVRHILEPQCAGKQSCGIIVSKINAETNCNDAFRFHLEVDYSCIRG